MSAVTQRLPLHWQVLAKQISSLHLIFQRENKIPIFAHFISSLGLTVIARVRITRHRHAGSTVPSNERDRRRARDCPVIDRRRSRRP